MLLRLTLISCLLLIGLPILFISLGCLSHPPEPADEADCPVPAVSADRPAVAAVPVPEPARQQVIPAAEFLLPLTAANKAAAADEIQSSAAGSFVLDLSLQGRIGYFCGRSNAAGTWLPDDPLRFLGGEVILLDLFFSRPPWQVTISLAGETWQISGHPGRTYYRLQLAMPPGPSTLDWQGQRLAEPFWLVVTAVDWQDRSLDLVRESGPLERTGSVRDLVHPQPVFLP